METVSDFILGGSKITADGDCSHKIKRCLLLGRKVMNKLDSILKSRDITLPTNVHLASLWFFLWSCMDVRVEDPLEKGMLPAPVFLPGELHGRGAW